MIRVGGAGLEKEPTAADFDATPPRIEPFIMWTGEAPPHRRAGGRIGGASQRHHSSTFTRRLLEPSWTHSDTRRELHCGIYLETQSKTCLPDEVERCPSVVAFPKNQTKFRLAVRVQ